MPATIPKSIDPAAVTEAQRQTLTPSNEKRMRELLDAICDPTRVKIVRALRDVPLAASDIARVIGRDRAATSQHLRVLRQRGAIAGQRTGNVIRYALTNDVPGSVIEEACAAFDQLQPKTASAR